MQQVLLALFALVAGTFAMQANPAPFTVQQPDGSLVTLFLRGNEHFNMLKDPFGYTVLETASETDAKPKFVYAAQDRATGALVPTQFAVGQVDPVALSLKPSLRPPMNSAGIEHGSEGLSRAGFGRRDIDQEQISRVRRIAATGTVNNLVLMLRWANGMSERMASTQGLPTIADLDPIFNGQTNSLRDVYRVNSYGRLTIVSSYTGWITVNITESAAAMAASGMACCVLHDAIRQALTIADRTINFANFDIDRDGNIDMITILHSGYAAEAGGAGVANRIWSHKWALSTPFVSAEGVQVTDYHISSALWGTSGFERARIGVIAHESGHFFGLPDLYDVDGYVDPVTGGSYGTGLGSYSLMANSWGFDYTQNFPPILDAWSRIQLGFVAPTLITTPGTYSVSAAGLVGSQVYKIAQGFPAGEYLLIENRQKYSYDSAMPQGGLAIYHVDEKVQDLWSQGWPGQRGWPQNGNHYQVALVQADGLYQLESTEQRGDAGDVWFLGGKNTIGPNTVPNTKSYQSGVITDTGVTITVISGPAQVMSFTVSFAWVTSAVATPAATCTDGIKNQGETGIDCGGPCKACATCLDGIQNQGELGIDCGGPCAKACAPAPTCFDKIQNQGEAGVDCGGPCQAKCPTCFDGIQNQGETGVDCGGPCAKACAPAPTCFDRIQNQGELGIDCGGPCAAKCATCSDGIQNQGEKGIDCGGPCARACPQAATTLLAVGSVSLSQARPSTTLPYVGQTRVRVLDGTNTPVNSAVVTVQFTRTVNGQRVSELRSSTTNAMGQVIVKSTSSSTAVDPTLMTCVYAVTKGGMTYTGALNLVTCVNAIGQTSKTLVLTI